MHFALAKEDRRLLKRSFVLAAGIRIGLLVLAYLAGRMFLSRETPATDLVLDMFARWDAHSYLLVAQQGYSAAPQLQYLLAFFPLYPLAIRLFNYLFLNPVTAALVVSFLASVAARVFLQKRAKKEGDEAFSERSLAYFFLFPTAYFLAVPYSESLFFALVLGAFFFAREGKWNAAGILGMLAVLTRGQGIVLFPALLAEAYLQKAEWKKTAGLLLIPLGLVLYLGINFWIGGSPLAFMDYQQKTFSHRLVAPWNPITDGISSVLKDAPSEYRTKVLELPLLAFGGTALALLISARWLRPSYQLYGWLLLALFGSLSFQISMPRYVMAVFPWFFILARPKNENVHRLLLPAFSISMGGLFFLYSLGRWAF